MLKFILSITSIFLIAAIFFQPAFSAEENKPWGNQKILEAVYTHAKENKIGIRKQGQGPVRLLFIGTVDISDKEMKQLVKLGEEAIKGLEAWTGHQKLFIPKDKSEDQAYCILVIGNDELYTKFVHLLRKEKLIDDPKGKDDLDLTYKNFDAQRLSMVSLSIFKDFAQTQRNWMVSLSSSLAIKTFFGERGTEVPEWLNVSLAADLELLICKSIRLFQLDYEKNDQIPSQNPSTSWGNDFKNLIKKGNNQDLLTAHGALQLDLASLSYTQHIQLYSIGSFIRSQTIGKRGEKNKFAQIIQRIANKESDIDAISEVLKAKTDKILTMGWHKWALSRR